MPLWYLNSGQLCMMVGGTEEGLIPLALSVVPGAPGLHVYGIGLKALSYPPFSVSFD